MDTTVRQMLSRKPEVFAVAPDDTVFDALRLMSEKNVGAVLVMSESRLEGILSERDYARKVILHGRMSHATAVKEIMTTDVVCVDPAWTADQCMALMTEKRVRHLPVVDHGDVVGVISIGDAVRAIVDEQAFTIKSLERYLMTGS
jgi:CBS domain-containing protein